MSFDVKRALISVYDKTGLVPFAKGLAELGVEIVSSGGTASALLQEGISVTKVGDVTGSPEMLGGRVKTLHPKIHGAILARPDNESDMEDLQAQGIETFQLVVVNLYPFRETLVSEDASPADIIEMIDIGGPAMVRAAAKNHLHVGVVTSPGEYQSVLKAIADGAFDIGMRQRLAADAFFHTASYDAAIAGWMGDNVVLPLRRLSSLRYGENPHQAAGLYVEDGAEPWWTTAQQHQGKDMSFNNYADADAAWRLAADLGDHSVVVVKHTNPCGAALGDTVFEAFGDAWEGDPLAAFGGVVAINGVIDEKTARAISERFVEVVVARSADLSALEVLSDKANLRVLTARLPHGLDHDYRRIEDGFVSQERDLIESEAWQIVSKRRPSDEEVRALDFAWKVAAAAKSNSIVLARDEQAVAVGAGDQSRVGAAERAVVKAGDRATGAVAASDAFFPFRDGLDTLAGAGVTAVVEPGGSRNDDEVVAAADEHGMALVFAGNRHFRH